MNKKNEKANEEAIPFNNNIINQQCNDTIAKGNDYWNQIKEVLTEGNGK